MKNNLNGLDPIGRVALDIRGISTVISSCLERNNFDLVPLQLQRISNAETQLSAYKSEWSYISSDLNAFQWYKIALEELKEIKDKIYVIT